jgi:peptidyl-tRNA hydrolase
MSSAPAASHSTTALVLTAAAALTAGAALGAATAARRRGRLARALAALGLAPPARPPPARPAAGSPLPSPRDRAVVAIVVRADAGLTSGDLARQAANSLLGQFRKLYAARSPELRLWEACGQPIVVLAAADLDAMTALQQAARGVAPAPVPTHTWAGRRPAAPEPGAPTPGGPGKMRSVMVVGPARGAALSAALGAVPLQELA